MSSAPSLRPATTSYFDLPHRLDAKTVPELIARDDEHFSAVARSLHRQAAELDGRLDALRQRAGSHGEAALERDTEIHRLTAQLRLLQRFDVDVCLGRMVFAGDGVRMCTLADLVPEGEGVGTEDDPEVARIKASADPEAVLEAAVRLYEEAPVEELVVATPWADIEVGALLWRAAFESAEPGTSHNEARMQVWDALVEILYDRLTEEEPDAEAVPVHHFRRALAQDEDLHGVFSRAWPLLDPRDIVGDLWTVPAYARMCMPWLTDAQALSLRRDQPRVWTMHDLPFLDVAHRRIGDPEAGTRERRRAEALAAEREERERVRDDLIASDDSDLQLMSMLRGHDLQGALDDEAGESASARADSIDRLVGPFAHIVIDEAQELTDAEWRVVLARCPSRSLTIVGDRAQARRGFAEEWTERLARVGLSQAAGDRVEISRLSVNYRTPAEIMAEAEPVIRAALPDANVPGSVREAGGPVRHASVTDLDRVLGEWLRTNSVGTACVIAPAERVSAVGGVASTGGATSTEADSSESVEEARVRVLTPESAKGLEADLVVLIDPTSWGEGIRGAVDRYVAMTRSTQQLVVLAGD